MSVFDDDFAVGSDVTDLGDHIPTIAGTGWTRTEMSAGGKIPTILAVDDFVSIPGIATSRHVIYEADDAPPSGNYQVECDIWTPASLDDPAGVVARLTDASNFYFAGSYVNSVTNNLKLYKMVAGSATLLAESNDTFADGDTLKLQVYSSGVTRVELFLSDVSKLTSGDTDLTSIGLGGIWAGNLIVGTDDYRDGVKFDNFKITDNASAVEEFENDIQQPSFREFGIVAY